MNYIQQQNLSVAKKLKTVSSIDIRYFHLDIPVKCKMENGVVRLFLSLRYFINCLAFGSKRAQMFKERVAQRLQVHIYCDNRRN